MIKLAIFSNDLSVGGIQKSLYNLLRNLNYSKYEVDLYLMNNKNFYQDKIPEKVNIIYLKKHTKFIKYFPYNLLKRILKYEGLSKDYDYAIDFDSYQSLTALNALKCSAKIKIMWIHNDQEQRKKYDKKYKINHFLTKNKNKYFDIYVGVSKGVIEPFKKVNNLTDIKYKIIPNLIDTEEIFTKKNEKCSLKVDQNKYNLCSAGSVNVAKNFDETIKTLKELTKYRTDFHFYLIGDGPEMTKIKNITKELELETYVTFLGYQKNPYKYMNLMDGFILMSRYEGQGMVIMEAKALGLELFIHKRLEKYNTNIKGYDNIIEGLKKAQKKSKKYDKLNAYNSDILKKIDNLFSE